MNRKEVMLSWGFFSLGVIGGFVIGGIVGVLL